MRGPIAIWAMPKCRGRQLKLVFPYLHWLKIPGIWPPHGLGVPQPPPDESELAQRLCAGPSVTISFLLPKAGAPPLVIDESKLQLKIRGELRGACL